MLPAGSFDTNARNLADPAEIALFRVNFDSLRAQTALQLMLNVGMNLGFCNRFKRVVEVLIETVIESHPRKVKTSTSACATLEAKRQVCAPRPIALLFQAFAVILIVSVDRSISASEAACAVYPQCAVFAYRWVAKSPSCPCILLIDANRSPLTYSEWIDPPDVTDTVKTLAVSGDLRVLMIINRKLVEWPEEMKHCVNLQHMYAS